MLFGINNDFKLECTFKILNMGTLKQFNLSNFCKKFNIKTFVETGAGPAWSLRYASDSNLFTQLFSVELDYDTFKKFENTYQSLPNTIVYNMKSEDFIKNIVCNIKSPTLFFLDAHFPGSEWGFYDKESDDSIRIPLETELKELVKVKDITKDVIIIDDLRIYIDGPFQGGNWEDRNKLGGNGIDFLYNILEKSHDIIFKYEDQGYIVCTPKLIKI